MPKPKSIVAKTAVALLSTDQSFRQAAKMKVAPETEARTPESWLTIAE